MEERLDARNAARELTERYDRTAGAYRELWAPILRTAALPLVHALAGEGVHSVLDVGTGVGALLPDLSGAFPRACVFGVDRSRGMIALAPGGYGRGIMDAQQLGVRSGSVDRVLLVFMLFHLERPVLALREARRVLRAGGAVGVLTWGQELQSAAIRTWTDCLDEHGAIGPDAAAEARHEVVGTAARMQALLDESGFHSSRAWEDDLVCGMDEDSLVRLRTSLGAAKARFDSLSPPVAATCVAEARRRMKALAGEDFIARGRVVHAIATA